MACKPGSVSCLRRRWPFLWDVRYRTPRATDPDGDPKDRSTCRPYLVLLPVGLAMPSLLPESRCALTAPFQPCRTFRVLGGVIFCGAVPGVAPGGCYPSPCPSWSPDFPRLSFRRDAAIRPSDAHEIYVICPWPATGAESAVVANDAPPMGKPAIVFLCLLAAAPAPAQDVHFVQDQAHYEAAVHDMSTAPYFVLVTIVDDGARKSWTGCTLPRFRRERDRRRAWKRQRRRRDRARPAGDAGCEDHVFHFANPRALSSIAMDAYAPGDLDRARAYLHAHGTGVPPVVRLGQDRRGEQAQTATALACAIIERGLAAHMSDGTGEVFAEP